MSKELTLRQRLEKAERDMGVKPWFSYPCQQKHEDCSYEFNGECVESARKYLDGLRERVHKADQLAEEMGRFINGANHQDIGAFIDGMSRQHRTLQQLFTGLVIAWFRHLARLNSSEYDLRNEASVQLAKSIDNYLPYTLPLI